MPSGTIDTLYEKFLESSGICTDSRKVTVNSIFFALKGDKYDANRFAAEALERGAGKAVIDDPAYRDIPGTVLVDDCLACLQALARHHRQQLNIPVIGLSGSNGKTTTKELIRNVLASKYAVFSTSGNLNNHIGVPLSILSIEPGTEIAVIEMGANRIGDIALLCSIARPSHGFLTNIGKAHIGYFGGIDGVIRGKSELYDFLIKTDGTVFINRHQHILMNMAHRFRAPLFYPEPGDFYHCRFLDANPYVRLATEAGAVLETRLIGKYNFDNIATALCVGKHFGVDPDCANAAVSAYRPDMNRSQVERKGRHLLILDAYNANPTSMELAIESLQEMGPGPKVAVLGDMYELGDASPEEHRHIGELLSSSSIETILLCGEHMEYASSACARALYFPTKAQLSHYLSMNRLEPSTILIKASRGMALEDIAELIG